MDAEQEYVEAKAAYAVALARLSAAKKARPKQPTKYELRDAQNQRISDAVWQAYVDGTRDYHILADRFGRSSSWVGSHIRDILRERRFGPETLEENEWRLYFHRRKNEPIRAGHSDAWHRVRQMYEDQRIAAEQAGLKPEGIPMADF